MHAALSSVVVGLTTWYSFPCIGQVVQSTGRSAINPSPIKPTAQIHNDGQSTEISGK